MTFQIESIKSFLKRYFLQNYFSTTQRKVIRETTPNEIVKHAEKLSLKQREQLGLYGIS